MRIAPEHNTLICTTLAAPAEKLASSAKIAATSWSTSYGILRIETRRTEFRQCRLAVRLQCGRENFNLAWENVRAAEIVFTADDLAESTATYRPVPRSAPAIRSGKCTE